MPTAQQIAERRARGECVTCGQVRPIFRPKTPPPVQRRRRESPAFRRELKRQIAALHPDRNGGASPDPLALQQALQRLHRSQQEFALRVAAGFKIFARKCWWLVERYGSGGWYHCSRKVPTTTSSVAPVVKRACIHISEMTDSRCGYKFRWRMLAAHRGSHWGIPWPARSV